MNFGSDNQAGASQPILEKILQANGDYTHGYGDDQWTQQAVNDLKTLFECDIEVFFVPTGTAANALALSCLVKPWEMVLCHHQAHIYVDESTAPEFYTGGARMIPLAQGEGKLTPEHIQTYFKTAGTDHPHNAQAKAISITQASEAGLVYSPEEIRAISQVAKQNGLYLHIDGARFANALAAQKCSAAQLTWQAGVDVLSLGATKCGALCAEAVVFFNKKLAEDFSHKRKRSGHLLSKGRLFGAQFVAWLADDHYLQLATHANQQAMQLAHRLSEFPQLKLAWPVEANELFVVMPTALANFLMSHGAEFYEWSPAALPKDIQLKDDEILARLVTSFASQDEDREIFCNLIAEFLA